MSEKLPFWKTKKLEEMDREEWEALCDGCGICCLEKLEDADSGEIFYTNTPCRHFDREKCNCSVYSERYQKAPECYELTPENIETVVWLPETCAYRLIKEGKDLFWWHYLLSGDTETVHTSGMSILGYGI